ncbi:FBXW7 protein, partial [Polyodon spathula]|nr:FBXW7 protein [Polyodon spathula]
MSGSLILSPEIRKLRKKLRQIENLEVLPRGLTCEEADKLARRAALRKRLADLLKQQSLVGNQQEKQCVVGYLQEEVEQCIVDEPSEEKEREGPMKRGHSEDITRVLPQDLPDRPSGLVQAKSKDSPADKKRKSEEPTTESGFKTLKGSWEGARFRLRSLEGHSDIITCIIVVDDYVISGSRDTTVKVWHVPTASEERNLGGHTGGVTCLGLVPQEHSIALAESVSLDGAERFVLSGSVDSAIIIWALNRGCSVRNIYTYSSVTALHFISTARGGGRIVTGSEGGKVELWDPLTGQNCQSVRAHEDAVTSLQPHGPLLFSGSADGSVKVWEVERERKAGGGDCVPRGFSPIRLLKSCDSNPSSLALIRSLTPRGKVVYIGTDHSNIHKLDWKTGAVSKLANHSSGSGVTDCVWQTGDGLLLTSSFDLDTGESSLNLRSLPDDGYLATLSWPDAPRFLCLSSWLTGSGGHRWVTGGRSLTVWEQLPANSRERSEITIRRITSLESGPTESGSEEESEEKQEEEDEGEREKGGEIVLRFNISNIKCL